MKTCMIVLACSLIAILAGCRAGGGPGPYEDGSAGTPPRYGAGTSSVEVPSLPSSSQDFDALLNRTATSPEGAAACFIVAAMLLEKNPALGEECMIRVASPTGNNITNGRPGVSFRELIRRMREQPWVARSYVQGATPENGYRASAPYRIVFDNRAGSPLGQPGGGRTKLFVVCGGADSARPITISSEAGGYRIYEASSISLGVRPPKAP